MVRHTWKILQLMQDFSSVSDHFTTLRSKGLKNCEEAASPKINLPWNSHLKKNSQIKVVLTIVQIICYISIHGKSDMNNYHRGWDRPSKKWLRYVCYVKIVWITNKKNCLNTHFFLGSCFSKPAINSIGPLAVIRCHSL